MAQRPRPRTRHGPRGLRLARLAAARPRRRTIAALGPQLGKWRGAARLALRLGWGGLRHRPRRQSAADRLAALPTSGLPLAAPVDIRWSGRLVPFIDAASDRDLAVALGLVHAHLRLAQMEAMRRLAEGRLAEVLGPVALPFDHALRLLDLTRAVPAIAAALPGPTRDWLAGFVAGINHHLASDAALPLEFRVLGIARPAPWRVEDVLAVARLAAADVSWLLWRRLLRLPRRPDWPQDWARLIAAGTVDRASGSNAVAVAGQRSATGRPFLAGDPHLPLLLPNLWLAAGYRSPSYNVAGLMIPGIPVVAIGRNRHLAWGGTNLHAASSELFDVSELPAAAVRERKLRLAVRWSRPRDIVLRDTDYGPIVTDAVDLPGAAGRTLALRWVGHAPSDEISALLAIDRAGDAAAFRAAAAGIAAPGQTLVFAEVAGRIGRVTAARLPRRTLAPPDDIVSPPAAAAAWQRLAGSAELPAETDPPRGFIASANNRPPAGEVPVGWFFSPDDRVRRLAALLRASERIGLAELAELLRDVASPAALVFRDRLCAALDPPPDSPEFAALAGWDGGYAADSAGALAFELVLARLVEACVPPPRRELFGTVWRSRPLLYEEIERLSAEERAGALCAALAGIRPALRRLGDWGGAHRLRLNHPFAALPAIGRRYRLRDRPWPGSNDTVFKSAHPPVRGRHPAGYGSNARYVFDLADPDGNRIVLLGGQDGAPGSAAFADQVELFERGAYLEIPLEPETARRRFPHRSILTP